MQVLHVEIDESIPSDIVNRFKESLHDSIDDDIRIIVSREGKLKVSMHDPDTLAEIKSDIKEIKEFLFRPRYILNEDFVGYDDNMESFEPFKTDKITLDDIKMFFKEDVDEI
jgi:hypothetical protein